MFSTVGHTRLITMLSIHHMFSTVGNTRLITMLSIHHSNSSVTRLLNIYMYVISDILNKLTFLICIPVDRVHTQIGTIQVFDSDSI